MSDWFSTTLGEMISVGNGKIQTGPFGSQLHASDYVEDGIPCIMPANMQNNRVNLNGIARITEEDANRLSQHLVKSGDIVYSRRGDVTQKALIRESEEGYFCGTGCLLIKPGEKLDSEFMTYYLSTSISQNWIVKQAVGATMPNLNTSILANVPLKIPPKPIQRKIASVLSAIDAKIELNNRINVELEAMAKTLYDYWFVQFDFPFDFAQGKPDANGKPYKSSGGKMVYSPTLKREIPEGWEISSLWIIAKYFNGLAMQKYRPTGEEFLPVIKIREMNEGFSDSTEKARTDLPIEAIVNDGDILFSWSATLDVKIWSQGRGALNQHIFKVTSDKYPKTFCYFELLNYLKHFKMMAELRKTTMGHITLDHLKQAKICLPPLGLLKQGDQFIEPIFKKHLMLEKENGTLGAIRNWLLPMLMNGQVTVK